MIDRSYGDSCAAQDPSVRVRTAGRIANGSERRTSDTPAALSAPHASRQENQTAMDPLNRRHSRGQSLAELAIIAPILLLVVAGIVQYGMSFNAQNNLTAIAETSGRWLATQRANPCSTLPIAGATGFAATVNQTAIDGGLIGYSPGTWNASNVVAYPEGTVLPTTPPAIEGVEATWSYGYGPETVCPPSNKDTVWTVKLRVSHQVPSFFAFLPINRNLTGTAQFRMEPPGTP